MITIYADVLVGLNWFVNFFLLLSVSKIGKTPLGFARNMIASFVLALGSLSIFLPPFSAVGEVMLRVILAGIGVLLGFGFGSVGRFFKNVGILFAATFAYGGIMLGLWYVFRPEELVIHNGTVYYNLSPVLLIAFTLGAYGILRLLRKNFAKESIVDAPVLIHIQTENKTVGIRAKVDTGFTLEDAYTGYPIVLVTPTVWNKLFRETPSAYRLLPFETVNGAGMLKTVTVKGAFIRYEGNTEIFPLVSVAKGETAFSNQWDALVGYDFIERMKRHETNFYEDHTKIPHSVCSKKN